LGITIKQYVILPLKTPTSALPLKLQNTHLQVINSAFGDLKNWFFREPVSIIFGPNVNKIQIGVINQPGFCWFSKDQGIKLLKGLPWEYRPPFVK